MMLGRRSCRSWMDTFVELNVSVCPFVLPYVENYPPHAVLFVYLRFVVHLGLCRSPGSFAFATLGLYVLMSFW